MADKTAEELRREKAEQDMALERAKLMLHIHQSEQSKQPKTPTKEPQKS